MSHQSGKTDMAALTTVTVTLMDREDGGLRVSSTDLPGLILSGSDALEVAECIAPAIVSLFEHRGLRVTVKAAQSLDAFLSGPNPRDVAMRVTHESGASRHQIFVVEAAEFADAA